MWSVMTWPCLIDPQEPGQLLQHVLAQGMWQQRMPHQVRCLRFRVCTVYYQKVRWRQFGSQPFACPERRCWHLHEARFGVHTYVGSSPPWLLPDAAQLWLQAQLGHQFLPGDPRHGPELAAFNPSKVRPLS
jgi:hypothetical protein